MELILKKNYRLFEEEDYRREERLVIELLKIFGCDFVEALEGACREGVSLREVVKKPYDFLPHHDGPAEQRKVEFFAMPDIMARTFRETYGLEKFFVPQMFYESHSGDSMISIWSYRGGCGMIIVVHLQNSSLEASQFEGVLEGKDCE
jgi:hypothetical protein